MALLNVLTINIGSSSLKASLFEANGNRRNFQYSFTSKDNGALSHSLEALLLDLKESQIDRIGHRFVHGGNIADLARTIDDNERARLQSICHLAPLHMPKNLMGVDFFANKLMLPQVACFDTAFHATLPEMAYRLPIPQHLNMRRYGFHGLNYAYVAKQLSSLIGNLAHGRVIVAHLGSGASLCVLEKLKSVDTSMGFTPAGGIPMATRSGDLDPGVMLALAKQYSDEALSTLVYEKMGLFALSNEESSDVASLVKSKSVNAQFALKYFARAVRGQIGSYAAQFGGFDALVFTGGIGEHSAYIRNLICEELTFLNIVLDLRANALNASKLHMPASKPILLIAADEESEIARLTSIQ
jgi:acetate kinase